MSIWIYILAMIYAAGVVAFGALQWWMSAWLIRVGAASARQVFWWSISNGVRWPWNIARWLWWQVRR